MSVAERLVAADRLKRVDRFREQMDQIAERNNASGRLGSGMYAKEQRHACEKELDCRARAAWDICTRVLTPGASAISQSQLRAWMRALIERDRTELTQQLHSRIARAGHSTGLDDLSPAATRVQDALEAEIDLFFLNQASVPRRTIQQFAAPDLKVVEACWRLLHPSIVEVARPRFESGHFSDAAEAAFKVLSASVKAKLSERAVLDFDGAQLMNRVFSPNNPLLILGDPTETGRSIQLGYMQLFTGAMTGIRNPKAHAIVEIDWVRCIHFLFVASLLRSKVDEAVVSEAPE